MRILFAGKQHYDPGGISASTDQLAHRLALAGHDVFVFAHAPFGRPPPPEPQRRTLRREEGRGYEAWSADLLPPGPGLDIMVRRVRPDVLVVNAGGTWWHDWTCALVQAAPAALPVVIYVRDPQAVELLGEPGMSADLVLANAEYHAGLAARRGVTAVVVPSVVEPELYRTEPTGEAVLFINPVATKGAETAFALAEQRPDVRFHFRESWRLPAEVAQAVADRADRLGNVTFLPSSDDTVGRYRRARLLLAPYEELGRPRVVAEAQVSGIPVLARDDPALREAVGPGGILVPPDAPLGAWLDGLSRLWDDDAAHARHSDAARLHSERDEIDADRVAARFVAAITDVVRRGPSPRVPLAPAPDVARTPPPGEDRPMASVVVPVRDVADTIDEQLSALAGQTYAGPWEVVVADNGSTDDTLHRVEAWRHRLPSLTIVDASARRGVAHARNTGLGAAGGDLLLICDGDDVVAPDWLEHMVTALEDHPIVTGVIDLVSMNREEQYAWTGDADVADAPIGYRFLPYAAGGNIGMWRDVFDVLAGFDETLRRAEDIDFGWRAAYLGISVHFEPRAVLHHRIRSALGAVLRSGVRGGMAEPGLYRRHRAQGMPRESWREVAEMYRWLVRMVPAVRAGGADRHRWVHHAGTRLGRLAGSVRHRVVFL